MNYATNQNKMNASVCCDDCVVCLNDCSCDDDFLKTNMCLTTKIVNWNLNMTSTIANMISSNMTHLISSMNSKKIVSDGDDERANYTKNGKRLCDVSGVSCDDLFVYASLIP